MLGTDGRLFDPSFDFDGDGKLNGYEYAVMDDIVLGHDEPAEDGDYDFDQCYKNGNIFLGL